MVQQSEKASRGGSVKHRRPSVARATGTVSAVTMISRVLGMLRDVLIAKYFGAGFATDAFFTAFKIPNLLRRLVAEGSLSTAFVPVISEELLKSRQEVRRAIREASGFCLLLTAVLSIAGMCFADEITLGFAMGWSKQADKLSLASSLLFYMFPYVVLISATALAAATLNALGYFAWAAAAPALLNVSFILAIVLAAPYFEPPIYALCFALLFGGMLGLVPMLFSLHKLGYTLMPSSPFQSSVVRKLLRLMVPAVLSSSVYQVMVFLNSILVTMLEEGSPSWLYFADRLFQFPLGVFSIALATAVLPALSSLSANQEQEGFNKLLTQTLSWVAFVTIPATAGLVYLSLPIVQVIYQSGQFGVYDAQQTAFTLIAFSLGLLPLSGHTVLVRAFLAKKNSATPAKMSVLSIAFNICLALVFMGIPVDADANFFTRLVAGIQHSLPVALQESISLGHIGLALAGSLASLASLGLLMLSLNKIQVTLLKAKLGLASMKSLFATTLMLLAMHQLAAFISLDSPIASLVIQILAGIGAYAAVSFTVRSEEMYSCIALLSKYSPLSRR